MTIAAGYWTAAIDFMYSGRPKTRRSRRPVAAVFAPAAIGPPQLLVFLVVIGDPNFDGRLGKGASKLRTFNTFLAEGRLAGSGWQHHKSTTIKHWICSLSNSIFNL